MKRRLTILTLLLLMGTALQAQGNRSLVVKELTSLHLPASADGIAFCDGKLHVRSADMLFMVRIADDEAVGLDIDTVMLAVDDEVEYMVRNAVTGTLYFTKKDGKGISRLYEYYEKKPGTFSSRRIQPQRFSYAIEHPVFALGDSVMVFASDCPLGMGGKDLWYSVRREGEWQYPQNLGFRINSEGDEESPTMYGDYLIFSSDGHAGSRGGKDLYATRLFSAELYDESIGQLPLGRDEVYSMAEPFCSRYDDVDLTFNADGSMGWWRTIDADSNIHLFSYRGRLDGVKVVGTISGADGGRLLDARVTVSQAGRPDYVVNAMSDGAYELFLQPGEDYELTFTASNYFAVTRHVTGVRMQEGSLYAVDYMPIILSTLSIDSMYAFNDFFNAAASSELSVQGRKRMSAVARFLADNPHLHVLVNSAYAASNDATFCDLLNRARILSLVDFLTANGVPLGSIEYQMPDLPSPKPLASNETLSQSNPQETEEADAITDEASQDMSDVDGYAHDVHNLADPTRQTVYLMFFE